MDHTAAAIWPKMLALTRFVLPLMASVSCHVPSVSMCIAVSTNNMQLMDFIIVIILECMLLNVKKLHICFIIILVQMDILLSKGLLLCLRSSCQSFLSSFLRLKGRTNFSFEVNIFLISEFSKMRNKLSYNLSVINSVFKAFIILEI